jgi:hypothetical protein
MTSERIGVSPEDQCGPVIASQVILGRSDRAAIALHVLIGYPGGIVAKLSANVREPSPHGRQWLEELRSNERPGGFRIAFDYSEPSEPFPMSTPRPDQDPLWRQEIGSGSDLAHDSWMWIYPYPPDGQLIVSCSWSDRGIEVVSNTLAVPTPEEIERRTLRLWG